MWEHKPYLCRYLSQLQRRVYWRDWLFCEVKVSVYRQHIRQPQYQQIKVEEHFRLCFIVEFSDVSLEKSVQRLFHRWFQTSFKTKVVSCVTNRGFNMTSFWLNLLPRERQILGTWFKWQHQLKSTHMKSNTSEAGFV